ncbi:MAG: hypothetical protein WB992_08035 [Bryobacteraceae bacterium]
MRFLPVLAALICSLSAACAAQSLELKNDRIAAKFGPRGLVSIQQGTAKAREIRSDTFSFELDHDRFEGAAAKAEVRQSAPAEISYTFSSNGYIVEVVYRIEPGWQFISKQIRLTSTPRPEFVVHQIRPVDLSFADAIDSVFTPGTYLPQYGPPRPGWAHPTREFGAFLRFPEKSGVMIVVQNPFLRVDRRQNAISIDYSPEMTWKTGWGPFVSDLACIGPYTLTGNRVPAQMTYEWKLPPRTIVDDGADRGEIDAFTDCVRAFLIHPPREPISVEVGWTLNDYQIDVATPEGRAEYKRVLDTTSALGIRTLLYSPANLALARMEQDADAWNWEHVLWLGFGQKLREGDWNPETGEIPSSVSEMLDYAKAKHVGLLAYVYPSLPFAQNPGWLVKIPNRTEKNVSATLASRDFQDFLLKELLVFMKRTGIAGYSFDYTFLNLPGSAYAQWWGWCRVLKGLREGAPEIVIDGRQTYQEYGPWSWLAGSYPHPTGNDEQPESFIPYPDLHFDRVSADRLRFVNYWYRNYQFAPEEIIPGYMTHQTERSINVPPDSVTGGHPKETRPVYTSYRQRDWDYLGYKYSVISSIATGGWNNVIDMIPGRDPQEYRAFANSPDKEWIRHWLDWASRNKHYLQHTQTILGPPAMGNVDGTSALVGDRGYLFLFNPNYKQLPADFPLDSSIGLLSGRRFLIRELYPQEQRKVGKPGAGIWSYGDGFHFALDGTSAAVLEIEPVPGAIQQSAIQQSIVFGSAGTTAQPELKPVFEHGAIRIEHVSGEPGTSQELGILLPEQTVVRRFIINGKSVPFARNGDYVSATIHFAGIRFGRSQQVELTGGANGNFAGTFGVPQRVFEHFAALQKAWPVSWNSDDYATTWLVPGRLLMFIQFAEPNDTMNVSMMLDGAPVELSKAYSSVRAHGPSFVGFYADLSRIKPDAPHVIALQLPPAATAQFQGVFFDNVEPEFTEQIAP